MALDWSHFEELAQKLEQKFPQTDLSVLEYEQLKEMLLALEELQEKITLEDFEDGDMEALINVWISLQYPEEPEAIPSSHIE